MLARISSVLQRFLVVLAIVSCLVVGLSGRQVAAYSGEDVHTVQAGDTVEFVDESGGVTERHTVTVSAVTDSNIAVSIIPGPTIVLGIGNSTTFDADGDGEPDVRVELLSITGNQAQVQLTPADESTGADESEKSNPWPVILGVAGGILLVGIVVAIVTKRSGPSKTKKRE